MSSSRSVDDRYLINLLNHHKTHSKCKEVQVRGPKVDCQIKKKDIHIPNLFSLHPHGERETL